MQRTHLVPEVLSQWPSRSGLFILLGHALNLSNFTRNVENASEETHSNKNSLSVSVEESAGLTFGLPSHPLEATHRLFFFIFLHLLIVMCFVYSYTDVTVRYVSRFGGHGST